MLSCKAETLGLDGWCLGEGCLNRRGATVDDCDEQMLAAHGERRQITIGQSGCRWAASTVEEQVQAADLVSAMPNVLNAAVMLFAPERE